MGKVTIRTSLTSKGFMAIAPWDGSGSIYAFCVVNLGSNPLSKIEIVSSLNLFNLAFNQYHFNFTNCTKKYNPKVYLSAVQIVGETWNYDRQNGQENGLSNLAPNIEKSGSLVN